MTGRMVVSAAIMLVLLGGTIAAQTSIRGSIEIGRAEHRVVDQNVLIPATGTVFGGALTLAVGARFDVQGWATGGKLVIGSAPTLEDHDLAEAHLLGGMKVRSWLVLQAGVGVRNFSNSLARQHWVTARIGATARMPLGFEGVTATARGYWIPVTKVSGLGRPDAALSAGIGLEWQGHTLGASALYTLERYDFPTRNGATRLEQLSILRLRVTTWWPRSHPLRKS